jgi:hypothetical protein
MARESLGNYVRRFGAKVGRGVHGLVGNPMPHSGPIVINLILSPMTPSAPFTPFWRLRCGSYNLEFVRTFDPGPTFQKKNSSF